MCKCENEAQADRCINEITTGMFTSVAELDDPKNAEAIHAAIGAYAETGAKLEGLALALELEDATVGRK